MKRAPTAEAESHGAPASAPEADPHRVTDLADTLRALAESRPEPGASWRPAPDHPHLLPGVAHLYWVELDRPDKEIDRFARILSDDEVGRASRFRFPIHTNRFIARRAILRILLSRYAGALPHALRFGTGRNGKPHLTGPPLEPAIEFNLSDSGGYALYAFVLAQSLGVDVERVRPVPELAGIVERVFSRPERDTIQHLPLPQRAEAFFNGWTRKEAVLKALGCGLAGLHPRRFTVSIAPGSDARLLHWPDRFEDPDLWSLRDLRPAAGFIGALAVRGSLQGVKRWTWTLPAS